MWSQKHPAWCIAARAKQDILVEGPSPYYLGLYIGVPMSGFVASQPWVAAVIWGIRQKSEGDGAQGRNRTTGIVGDKPRPWSQAPDCRRRVGSTNHHRKTYEPRSAPTNVTLPIAMVYQAATNKGLSSGQFEA